MPAPPAVSSTGWSSSSGRIQPIIATLATGAIFTGIAYLLRPIPGGSIDEDLGDLLTNETFGVIPTSLLLLAGVVLVVWVPFRNSVLGRGCYAAGSSEAAAFLSGVRVGRSRLAAYTLAGLLAACGGLFLALQTLSGDAQVGADYTLKSIAAVVIGGTSLLGGSGGVMGSIFGAYALRAISGLLLFAGVSPLAQPLFEGVVLMVAIGARRDPHPGQPQPAGTAQRAGDRAQRSQPAADPWPRQFRAGGAGRHRRDPADRQPLSAGLPVARISGAATAHRRFPRHRRGRGRWW